jgi:hypothetical protein
VILQNTKHNGAIDLEAVMDQDATEPYHLQPLLFHFGFEVSDVSKDGADVAVSVDGAKFQLSDHAVSKIDQSLNRQLHEPSARPYCSGLGLTAQRNTVESLGT